MNILRLAFELFVIYILYKFIFDFIIPIYKTTKQVRQKMNDVHQQMHQNQPSSGNSRFGPQQQSTPARPPAEDYIDYEEVK